MVCLCTFKLSERLRTPQIFGSRTGTGTGHRAPAAREVGREVDLSLSRSRCQKKKEKMAVAPGGAAEELAALKARKSSVKDMASAFQRRGSDGSSGSTAASHKSRRGSTDSAYSAITAVNTTDSDDEEIFSYYNGVSEERAQKMKREHLQDFTEATRHREQSVMAIASQFKGASTQETVEEAARRMAKQEVEYRKKQRETQEELRHTSSAGSGIFQQLGSSDSTYLFVSRHLSTSSGKEELLRRWKASQEADGKEATEVDGKNFLLQIEDRDGVAVARAAQLMGKENTFSSPFHTRERQPTFSSTSTSPLPTHLGGSFASARDLAYSPSVSVASLKLAGSKSVIFSGLEENRKEPVDCWQGLLKCAIC
jgi:hypothetical protein